MRTEARLYTSIWDDDPEWIARTFAAQWAYTMLISQRDLEHHGGIALRIPRWSQLASDMSEPVLAAAIDELAEHRFIVIDRDYGELFVRALVRQDRVYKQPNVLRSAADRLSEVRSPVILAAMHAELLRVNDLPDLTETCRLIVKEMLEATLPGAPRPIRRPRRPGKAPHHASGNPSPKATDDPSAEGAANRSGKGSPNPSGNATGSPSSRDAAYRSAQPTGKGSANRSTAAKRTPPAATAEASAPSPDASGRPRSDYRHVLADWLRGIGGQTPTADFVAAVERVLADALNAGEPAARVAAVLDRWQHEDGTDPARLATMIANATGPRTRADTKTVTTPTAFTAPASGRMGGWALEDLTAATVAITNPWQATLTEQPADQALEDIEYHVSRALIEGHRAEHVAACLAAWHASGSTDPWQLTDLIDAAEDANPPRETDATAPSPRGGATATSATAGDDATPETAEEWLATAKANP